MKQSHVTIKDIARILEISPSTVSRALKDHPDISPETRDLVKSFAEKVKYRPNALALSLRKQKSNTLGLIIPEIVHYFFSSVISGMEDVAYSEGYHMMICQSNENYYREVINTQALLDHRVDGMLISISKTTQDYRHFQGALENGIPIVFFDRICEDFDTDRVITDDFEGARIATNHLIKNGARRVLHLSAPHHLLIGKRRFEGYCKALENNAIKFDEKLVLMCDSREGVLESSQKLLAMAPGIDAIFAVNDSTAIAAMQVLQENGIKIPGDIQVIGFGDGPIASITSPPLSTVEQKGFEMGREAVRMLIQRIENPHIQTEMQTKIFTPTLVKRQSTT